MIDDLMSPDRTSCLVRRGEMEKGSRERTQESGGPMDDPSLIADLLVAEIYEHRVMECGEGRILEGFDRGQ